MYQQNSEIVRLSKITHLPPELVTVALVLALDFVVVELDDAMLVVTVEVGAVVDDGDKVLSRAKCRTEGTTAKYLKRYELTTAPLECR